MIPPDGVHPVPRPCPAWPRAGENQGGSHFLIARRSSSLSCPLFPLGVREWRVQSSLAGLRLTSLLPARLLQPFPRASGQLHSSTHSFLHLQSPIPLCCPLVKQPLHIVFSPRRAPFPVKPPALRPSTARTAPLAPAPSEQPPPAQRSAASFALPHFPPPRPRIRLSRTHPLRGLLATSGSFAYHRHRHCRTASHTAHAPATRVSSAVSTRSLQHPCHSIARRKRDRGSSHSPHHLRRSAPPSPLLHCTLVMLHRAISAHLTPLLPKPPPSSATFPRACADITAQSPV